MTSCVCMKLRKVTLLNSSILTTYGEFRYEPLTLDAAREIIKLATEVESAIGHASTAAMLSELLDTRVDQNRIEYQQQTGEAAIIFKLKSRPPEGKILDRDEIEEIGYEFGLLNRSR